MHTFTDDFDRAVLLETMMGPNAMRITEELAFFLPITRGMRILDLGCGMGLSSILLAQKYGATVFAADLWISPADNYARFTALGLADRIIPVFADATKGLPFAEGYFDMLVTVDAYHYFGANETVLGTLLPYVKKGGHIGMAVPGLQRDFPDGAVPEAMRPFWQPDMNFHSASWWRALWEKERGIRLETCREMDCLKQAWKDWLQSPNPYAQGDIAMMEAEGGKYFSLVQMTATVL